MEQDKWIEKVLNSTNGITEVTPEDTLFLKIKQRIREQETVSLKTVWLVAASIAVLVILNISILNSKSKSTKDATAVYLESTMSQSNQLYQ